MRIGFDAKLAFNNYGGLGNYSRYVISNICRFYPENDCFLYTPGISDEELFTQPEGSHIKKPGGPFKPSPYYWRSYRLTQKLNNDNIQLYHGLGNQLPYGIHRSTVRPVITIHDLIYLEHPERYKRLDRTIFKSKVKYGVKAAARIIAASKQTKEDIIRLLDVEDERIKVVYQGCHRQFYHRVSPEKISFTRQQFALPSSYLLYVGTIEERKNLLKIIEALYHGQIDIPLVVVGRKTSYFHQVKLFIESKGIKNIHFLDQVQVTDLPAIYQASQGFIYPSSYEGFGIPILEALNSGVPVITSGGGCLEETAGKGGILIDPENREEMIGAMKQILDDSALRDRLIREGGAHALKFREEQTIPSLYKVYLEAANA